MIQKVEVPLQFSYKYDINDNIIEESCFYKSLVYKITYNYDSQNILTKHVLVQNNKVDITLYKNGVITQKTITDKNNYLENRRYKYEYDTNGNWIKLNVSTIISETGKKQTQQETLVTKEINYYE